VCLWDEKGPPKVKDSLKDDIMDFIKKAQQVIIITMTPEGDNHNNDTGTYVVF
jgi:hypothetical protein